MVKLLACINCKNLLWLHILKVSNQFWGSPKFTLWFLLDGVIYSFILIVFDYHYMGENYDVFLYSWAKVSHLRAHTDTRHVYDTYQICCINLYCVQLCTHFYISIHKCKQTCQLSDDHTLVILNRNLHLGTIIILMNFLLLFLVPSDCKSRRSIWTDFLEGDA